MKQHPLCTDCETALDVMKMPVPLGLKHEWAALQTRRNFLGRAGKALGWAALASLAGEGILSRVAHAGGSPNPAHLPGGTTRASALCSESQARHLPLHVRWPIANRLARL